MIWEDILKRVGSADKSKIKAILDVAEKLHGREEMLQLEEEIDGNDNWANTVIKDLLVHIENAMRFNEGKEYQELKEMQRTLEKLQREPRDNTPKVYDSPSWNRIRYGRD